MLPVKYDAKATQREINKSLASSDLSTLVVLTGDAGTDVTYNSETNTLTIPQGDTGVGSEETPQQLLNKILQVDGISSNLDADKLDGNDSNHYLNVNSSINAGTF
jgi:hypothetical protein